MPKQESTTDLKALAVLGIIGYIAIIIATFSLVRMGFSELRGEHTCYDGRGIPVKCTVLQKMQEEFMDASQTETAPAHPEPVKPGGLGSEGSVCGGPNRLPCMPGFKCAVSAGETMGVCAKVEIMDNTPAVQ